MLRCLLILFFIIYIKLIIEKIFKLRKINSCINVLYNFINSATPSTYGPVNKNYSYNQYWNKALQKYPEISEFTSYSSPSLSYNDSDKISYANCITLYNELLMEKNYLVKELKESVNPSEAIKTIIILPSTLIKLLGFKPQNTVVNFLNLFGWILTYLLNLYSDEIKSFIDAFLNSR